ncbi:MAG: oligopeptide transporter, OPT family [Candidatus Caenarcaniphilales bacterium]|nr:oligopeptide transporter, OPT family [Candidatus Caenarcaniphilales bacterium]
MVKSNSEITIRGIVLGVILSILLSGANAYLALKVGMTVSACIPASVIAMTVLRMLGNSNILENNIVQTAASAGEALAAGAVFVLPTLILLSYWTEFPYWQTALLTSAGGTLGVLFTIPLRRILLNQKTLKFPEGVATAEVLKAGNEGGKSFSLLASASMIGAFFKFLQSGLRLLSSGWQITPQIGRSLFGISFEFSPSLLAVGYILGPYLASLLALGGLITWLVALPIYTSLYGLSDGKSGYEAAHQIWSQKLRYLGVGCMLVGGTWTLLSLVKNVGKDIINSLKKSSNKIEKNHTDHDLSENALNLAVVAVFLISLFTFICTIDQNALQVNDLTFWMIIGFALIFSFLAGFIFSAIAGYMAGIVGSSNNPVSPSIIVTILCTSLFVIFALGGVDHLAHTSELQMIAGAATAIICGSLVSCASAIAADNIQDLKAGQLVGATPYRQQIMLIVGVIASALVLPVVLNLLYQGYGFREFLPRPEMKPEESLAAPQAILMRSLVQGVFAGQLEWGIIGIGGMIAVIVIIFDRILKHISNRRVPVLSVALGLYLPLGTTLSIMIGGLIGYFARKLWTKRINQELSNSDESLKNQAGTLYASGLINGEALIGILLSIPFALFHNTEILRLIPTNYEYLTIFLGLLAFAGVGFMLMCSSRSKD